MRTTTRTSILMTGVLLCSAITIKAQLPPRGTNPTAPANVGQAVTLDGTAYKVSTKKVLATGVEYYAMKPATGKAVMKYYVRSNNAYNPTVFSQSQFESFFGTGKLSAFGTLKQATSSGKTLRYTTKGTTALIIVVEDRKLGLGEIPNSVLAADNPQGPGSDAEICKSICFADAIVDCLMEGQTAQACEDLYKECLRDVCEITVPIVQVPVRHIMISTRPILML